MEDGLLKRSWEGGGERVGGVMGERERGKLREGAKERERKMGKVPN